MERQIQRVAARRLLAVPVPVPVAVVKGALFTGYTVVAIGTHKGQVPGMALDPMAGA
ncbi:MAG: hypothetical protein ACJA2W_000299 [Planctomycetota bacterium]|jgi:hypothetical protein